MKKFLITLSIIAVAVVAMLGIHQSVALSASPAGGDLCGGTGGNGQVVSIGNNTFTLKLNNGSNKSKQNGGNLIVNLTDRSTIETSAGAASLSDLKIGDRVTLVGGPNSDGTFTADAVVVCQGVNTENGASQDTPLTTPKVNPDFKRVNDVINLVTILLFGLIWLGALMLLWLKKKKSPVYLLFFTIFYVYLYKVLDYTLLQFQSLILLNILYQA